MALLDTYLPVYEVGETHSTCVRADAAHIFQAIRSVTPAELPLMRLLVALRSAPALVRGRRIPMLRGDRPLLEAALQSGFVLLGEVQDQELVIGAVGQSWKLRGGGSVRISNAAEFVAFDRVGYAKVATNFLLEPHAEATLVRTETRVHATDPASQRAFARYWSVIHPGSALIRRTWLSAIKRRVEMD